MLARPRLPAIDVIADVRKTLRFGAGQYCVELLDACGCDTQVRILREGFLHQCVQALVAELMPPWRHLHSHRDVRRIGMKPIILRDIDDWPCIIWSLQARRDGAHEANGQRGSCAQMRAVNDLLLRPSIVSWFIRDDWRARQLS